MIYMFVCSRLDTMVGKRRQLLDSLVEKNHYVILVSMDRHPKTEAELRLKGISFLHAACQRNKISLLSDSIYVFNLIRILKRCKPDVVISYTIKPNVYSGIALNFYKYPRFIPIVTGLGFAFQEGGMERRLLKKLTVWLHRVSFRKAEKVIVQNTHNCRYLIDHGIVGEKRAVVIEGDGVNIPSFLAKSFENRLRFVIVARLLGEKGLRELSEAVEQVKNDYPTFSIELFGPMETSPDAISGNELAEWKRKGTLVWQGYCEDIDQLLKNADVFVLPSYHEGMSTAVCEAMAYGLPIVGTDIPGIRELVDENGYLVPWKQVAPLADALRRVLEATPDELRAMGDRSREIALGRFDRKKIMKKVEEAIG